MPDETSPKGPHLRRALVVLLEELVEPLHGLQESSLFGELDVGLADVSADGKSVLDARVEDHLVGDGAHFFEQLLGLVALFFGEDLVGFWLGRLAWFTSFELDGVDVPAAAMERG